MPEKRSKKQRKKKTPSYRQRGGYDQAIVTLTDAITKERRDYWLGEFESPESWQAYNRVIADWEAGGWRLPDNRESAACDRQRSSVTEIACEYRNWAQSYYPPAANWHIASMIRVTRQFFGGTPAISFGPNSLRLVRDAMVKGDPTAKPSPRKPWSRKYVNSQIQRLIRMFKWAASHEKIPASIYEQLRSVPALRRGKTPAVDRPAVKPVPIELVEAVRPHLSRQINALISLQLHTAARGCELIKLRPIDIKIDDRSGVWSVTLEDHKTSHLGHGRTIYFGPRAQEVIRPFLADRPLDAFLFSPAEADAEFRQARDAKRKTRRYSPNPDRVESPRKKPGAHYTPNVYRHAISRACDRVFAPPDHLRATIKPDGRRENRSEFKKRLTPAQRAELLAWKNAHRWHPHQLRHLAATLIRRDFGLEAARIALGHSSALVTDAVYAERDEAKVVEMMRKIG